MREVYRDIDMGRWQPIPYNDEKERVALASGDFEILQWAQDSEGWVCALPNQSLPTGAQTSLWYEMPSGLTIAKIAYRGKESLPTFTGLNTRKFEMSAVESYDASESLTPTNDDTDRTLTPGTPRRYVAAFIYVGTGGTPASGQYVAYKALTVYGNHGLTIRGSEPTAGFYPTDIAQHALANYNALTGVQPIGLGPVDTDATSYAVPHAAYLTHVPHEQIVDDMIRKQLGWHWGVWEPAGLHSDTPRLFLTAPPADATAYTSRRDLGDDFDAPRVRLDQLYDTARVAYTDAAGRQQTTTVTVSNPLLSAAGIGSRVLQIDAGRSTAARAAEFGTFALALALAAARGAGSATLPADVQTPTGRRPAVLLKAGRDRLRITDLPDRGALHEPDQRRYDTFHLRRVESTIDQRGAAKTRAELGTGADLMEVLGARRAADEVALT